MKAAVIYQKGGMPQYVEVPEPVVQNNNQLILSVKAAAIKHIDKGRASGKHYSTENSEQHATIIGGDGVGFLDDGTRVFAVGMTGMMAEKALVEKTRVVKLPSGIDDATAAALPNAVAGSAMALRFRAQMKTGDTVLINGATGVTGKVAVQIAKHYGAKKIIVTGRNVESLDSLMSLGADEMISINQGDAQFVTQLKAIHDTTPIDMVIDYLWGHTAELILSSLKGTGSFSHRVRYVSVGAITGENIQLSSAILRSADLQLVGSGLGSWSKEEMQQLFSEILPEMFELAASNKLKVETEICNFIDIEKVWNMQVPSGKRLVIVL